MAHRGLLYNGKFMHPLQQHKQSNKLYSGDFKVFSKLILSFNIAEFNKPGPSSESDQQNLHLLVLFDDIR